MSWRDCADAGGVLDAAAAAGELRRARQAGQTLDVLLSEEFPLSLADAYRVQDQVTAARLAAGQRRAGWKLGYTSLAMRAQMGIEAPNFGPLTDVMLLASPALLPGGALQPRVEPEIGLRLGRQLAGPCSAADALDACEAALACLEIVDSVWSGYRFTLADNTADGSSAAWAVVGPDMPLDDLAELAVSLSVDGVVVGRATGAAASGHPAAGLAWLAGQLAERGQALEAGDLVITGGLTSAPPLEAGHRISASFGDERWSVEVRRPRELAVDDRQRRVTRLGQRLRVDGIDLVRKQHGDGGRRHAGQSWFSASRRPVSACWPSLSRAGLNSGATNRAAPLKVNSAA